MINNFKRKERRKKRLLIPAIYFILEIIFMWLVLSILQIHFNILYWEDWSKIVMFVFTLYAFLKMLHIYKRQKSYPLE